MKKTLTVVGIVILALLILVFGIYFYSFSDDIVPASLIVTSGLVQLDSGHGFKPVTGIATLQQGDIVRAEAGARAAIVLYESSVTLLESNAQVAITRLSEDLPVLTQEDGITFTRFASITTIKSLDIKLPMATITTRGASYRVNMDGVRTYNGVATLTSNIGMENIAEANNAVVLDMGQWNKRVITSTEKAIMRENSLESANALKVVRNNLVFKNKKLLGIAEKQYGITPIKFLEILNQADYGKLDAADITRLAPVKVPSMQRIVDLSRIIAQEVQNYYAPTTN